MERNRESTVELSLITVTGVNIGHKTDSFTILARHSRREFTKTFVATY